MREFDEARNIAATGGDNPPAAAFVWDEVIVNNPTEGTVFLGMIVPVFARRRIYFTVEVKLVSGAADYYVEGEIEFRKAGQPVLTIPASIGRDDNPDYLQQSLPTFFPNPQPAGPNAIGIAFAKAYAGGTTAPGSIQLTPYELDVIADEVVYRVHSMAEKGTATKPKLRIWMGILSLSQ